MDALCGLDRISDEYSFRCLDPVAIGIDAMFFDEAGNVVDRSQNRHTGKSFTDRRMSAGSRGSTFVPSVIIQFVSEMMTPIS